MSKNIENRLVEMMKKRYPNGLLTKAQVEYEIQQADTSCVPSSVQDNFWTIEDVAGYLVGIQTAKDRWIQAVDFLKSLPEDKEVLTILKALSKHIYDLDKISTKNKLEILQMAYDKSRKDIVAAMFACIQTSEMLVHEIVFDQSFFTTEELIRMLDECSDECQKEIYMRRGLEGEFGNVEI